MKELARLPYKGGYIWVELKAPIEVGDYIYDWEFKLVHHHVEHGRTMGKVLVRGQSVNNPEIIEGLAFVDGVDVRELATNHLKAIKDSTLNTSWQSYTEDIFIEGYKAAQKNLYDILEKFYDQTKNGIPKSYLPLNDEVEFISEFVESVTNPNKIKFETQKLVWSGSEWIKYTEDFVDVEEKHLTEELLTYVKDGKTFLKTL